MLVNEFASGHVRPLSVHRPHITRTGLRRRLSAGGIAALLGAATAVSLLTATPAGADLQECSTSPGAPPCLVLNLRTGGDDLRGGDDNLNVTVNTKWWPPRTRFNVNQGMKWENGTWHQVTINLDSLFGVRIDSSEITNITLSTTFTGGLSGDNWNLDGLNISAETHPIDGRIITTLLYSRSGTPLFRFTGDNKVFAARIDAVLDGGFEAQPTRSVSSPWGVEGPDSKGIDINLGLARTGQNNAFIRTSSRDWNALLQTIPVQPNVNYVLRGWVRTSGHGVGADVNTGFFGVRMSGIWPPVEVQFGPTPANTYVELVRPFNPGNRTSVTVFCGFWGMGSDGWIQFDQISVLPA